MLRPEVDELTPATLVDNTYRVVRLVGRGGMGTVYEAEDIRLGRPVALKVLRSDLARQLQADERFLQEARILARVRSPFMATVYSIGATEAGRTFIAMEFIDGESLGDLLDRERWLKLPRAAKICERVCEALMEAHKLGIIHRDLKPDNILLTKIGSVDDYVKVVDLGLAKHVQPMGGPGGPAAKLTQQRLVVGTPAYMSPEQAAGREVGPASDMYALAVILYEMLTGFLPIDGETPQDFLRAHQLQPPVPLAQRRKDIVFPQHVEAFFQRALAKNPAERFGTAEDFLRELQQLDAQTADARVARPLPMAQTVRTAPRPNSVHAPAVEALEQRLDRAKERVRLELFGLVSHAANALYDALDAFAGHIGVRADAPVVVRVRLPEPEPPGTPGDRLPLVALFDEVRVRAGFYDDDPPSVARRKLLAWVQSLMPDRPDRASQVAHLLGLYTGVDFPDSPHLSHARAVPEVARIAAGAALVDTLRGLAGRSLLVLLIDRVELCTDTEAVFLRRLLRQLGATPVLVVAGWLGAAETVPQAMTGLLGQGAVLRVAEPVEPQPPPVLDEATRRVLAAALALRLPTWPDLLEAATGVAVSAPLARLCEAGWLRPLPASRLSNQAEYLLGEVPPQIMERLAHEQVDTHRALVWLRTHAVVRPDRWAGRLAAVETRAGDWLASARHTSRAAQLMRSLGAQIEAIGQFEVARDQLVHLLTEQRTLEAGIVLTEVALQLTQLLAERGDHTGASERAREAIEALRQLPGLREDTWHQSGVPLLAEWAQAEAKLGRGEPALAPLTAQLQALQDSDAPLATAQLPWVAWALGRCLAAVGRRDEAIATWARALEHVGPRSTLVAELSLLLSAAASGEQAVLHARKALAAARDARNLVKEVEALHALALALRDVGEMDDAEAQLGEALNTLGRIDQPRLSADLSVLLASLLQARGAIDEADAALAKACRAFAGLSDMAGLSDALRQRGEAQMAHGTYARALAFADEAQRQAQQAGLAPLQVRALLLTARVCAATGDVEGAHLAMEQAFGLLPSDAPSIERADCLVVLADLIEADVLTSDRVSTSLLIEAQTMYRELHAVVEADKLAKRLRAMHRTGQFQIPVAAAKPD
jgi:serine/threonine-protein kinase